METMKVEVIVVNLTFFRKKNQHTGIWETSGGTKQGAMTGLVGQLRHET